MDRYEILILTIPELTKDEESSLEDQLEKFLNDHKGSIISFDRWGKYRLAYPVGKNDYGVYFLMRFEVDSAKEFLNELRSLFYIKFNEMVMRHIVTRLKKDQSLEYQKPPSLEDAPKKHIGMFDKGEMKPRSSRFDRPSSDSRSFDSSARPASAELSKDSEEKPGAADDKKLAVKEEKITVSLEEVAKTQEPTVKEVEVVEEVVTEAAPEKKAEKVIETKEAK